MPLSNIDYGSGQDSMQDVFDKTNIIIDHINNTQIKWAVINIGDWNMDTTDIKSIDISGVVEKSKIRVVSAIIRSDADASSLVLAASPYQLNQVNTLSFLPEGAIGGFDFTGLPNIIDLIRRDGGMFDNEDFDSTSYNRGFLTIGYVE